MNDEINEKGRDMEELNNLNGKSLDIKQNKLEQLRSVLPEVFVEGKVDLEKFKLFMGDDLNIKDERYVLNWAGKADSLRVLQTKTTGTLMPVREESINFDETENVFIEGENLEVLKILQRSYHGKIKMIYIDPPYNTGNDSFIYPDRFGESKEEYLRRINEKSEDGFLLKEGMFRKNSKENGQYHSNWLSMMYPRLFLAKNLLKEDGVIFVSIDDNEVHNLRLLMNEIFGEENFIANIIWEKKFAPQNDAKWYSENHDHILCYGKNKDLSNIKLLPRSEEANVRYKNYDNDPRGLWISDNLLRKDEQKTGLYTIVTPNGTEYKPPSGRSWRVSEEKFKEMVKDNRIWFGEKGGNVPRIKRFLSEVQDGIKSQTIWKYNDVGHNQEASQELRKLFEGESYFDTPKPLRLLKRICYFISNNTDIVLDFFSGSATTAHACMQLNAEDGGNRKFIMVQLPETCDEKSEAYKAGYKNIADISKERIKRAISKIEEEKAQLKLGGKEEDVDLGFKVYKLTHSNFKIWAGLAEDAKELEKQMDMFIDPVRPESLEESILWELLIKSGYDFSTRIEKGEFEGASFYIVNDGELVLLLSSISEALMDHIVELKPKNCVALDKIFNGNDDLKANAVLQMRDAGIAFKSI